MKIKKITYLFVLLIALFVPAVAQAAESADQILAKCAAKVNGAPSISVKFTLEYGNKRMPCNIVISKDKYHLSSNDVKVWYDGTTQWTYLIAGKQLSITEPTAEELLESNPFAILNHYSKAYSCKKLAGSGINIQLTSKSKAGSIRKAVVSINPKTYLPTKVVVTLSNGQTMSASAGSAVIGKLLPSKTFVYNEKAFPAKETADLR